jgi:hypothetical protein
MVASVHDHSRGPVPGSQRVSKLRYDWRGWTALGTLKQVGPLEYMVPWWIRAAVFPCVLEALEHIAGGPEDRNRYHEGRANTVMGTFPLGAKEAKAMKGGNHVYCLLPFSLNS